MAGGPLTRILFALAALLAGILQAQAGKAETEAAFRAFLEETIAPLARERGVSGQTLAEAFAGLTLDWSLPDLIPPGSPSATPTGAFQAEFRSPGRYLDETALKAQAAGGRKRLKRLDGLLDRIAGESGVPAPILLSIWARESAFGAAEIPHDALRTVATQAFMGARADLFRTELVALLRILEEDHLPRSLMKSSWAGAMGQPQFLPSAFLAHAADGDGDGRRDIWGSEADTLASIARYLAEKGWDRRIGWGFEILLPADVPCTLEGPTQGRFAAEWQALGIRRLDGAPLGAPDDTLHLLAPAGRLGPAFLVSGNFYVLKAYNESDLYALYVGHLADRIVGPARIEGAWGKVGGYTRGDVRAMQERLIAAGFDVGGADGLVGWRTRVAIGTVQAAAGRTVTCYPDREILAR